ncbi:MAG: 5'/3'-nucleotidase SurE [Clostridia bacterium]|nr:5'/3'-nucleotidase SurE [Clostridia bacterium]MDE6472431.1 5'/3'-nucleotidase SurE [Clostridia bacterium]
MNILLVNDDGIYSQGILTLAEKLSADNDVTVVAPQGQMSGTGHSFTLYEYVNFVELHLLENVKCYAVNGTPADCVKVAINLIMSSTPDLIISGINKGYNLGTDIFYSGTVNSALEGAVHDIKSIAVSQEYTLDNFDFASDYIARNYMRFYNLLPDDAQTIFNINIPVGSEKDLVGVKFARLGVKKYDENYRFEEGFGYRVHCREFLSENISQDDDVWLYNNKYITISPVKNDWNNEEFFEKLKGEIIL